MAIVTFWNNGMVETSQSMTMAAVATSLAINYDYKILMVNTKFKDTSLENAFEAKNKDNGILSKNTRDIDTGIKGVAKAIMSNKASPEIIANYTKIIFKNLELLTDKNIDKEEFDKYIKCIKEIINLSNKYFDVVFVDLESNLKEQITKQILEISDIKVITLVQNLNVLDEFIKQKDRELVLQEDNKIISIGKYDEKSKYTTKNISKYIKEKKVFGIPYNTMFGMDAPEGKVADYIIRFRKINSSNLNANFVNSIMSETEAIIETLKANQGKIY